MTKSTVAGRERSVTVFCFERKPYKLKGETLIMNMKKTIFSGVVLGLSLAALAAFSTGCRSAVSPYEKNDAEGYNVSVKYDANGGIFTTHSTVIVDSYDANKYKSADGKTAEIALLAPDADERGRENSFLPTKSGCFLAGWYEERIETGKDEQGNPIYEYSGKWDFKKDRLEVDLDKKYSATEPAVTLYAAWVPVYEVEIYDLETKELLTEYNFDPLNDEEIEIPSWNVETGAMEMYKFPEKTGYTLKNVYYDAEGKDLIESDKVAHHGILDEEKGTAQNNIMKFYVEWTEGEWFHIYNADQFIKNAGASVNYVIYEDLDFEGKIWPTSFATGNFVGTIEGGGHKITNVSVEQTNNSKPYAGLFGQITEKAKISDVSFENVTFTIKSGTRVAGASYGLFAGLVSEGSVVENVSVKGGKIAVDSGCYFATEDYVIGLVCGMGAVPVEYSDISFEVTGDNPEKIEISQDGTRIELNFVTE